MRLFIRPLAYRAAVLLHYTQYYTTGNTTTILYCSVLLAVYINSDNFFLASWSEDLTMFEIWSRNFHDTLHKRFLISDSCRLLYYVPKLHAILYCIVLLHNMTCNTELNF